VIQICIDFVRTNIRPPDQSTFGLAALRINELSDYWSFGPMDFNIGEKQ